MTQAGEISSVGGGKLNQAGAVCGIREQGRNGAGVGKMAPDQVGKKERVVTSIPERYVEVLKAICDLPTAPFCEEHVARWVEGWAERMGLKSWRDGAGNVYVEYVRGEKSETPLVIEAHMDHPGFLVVGMEEGSAGMIVRAEFRGGVKPSYFAEEGVRFFVGGKWVEARIVDVRGRESGRVMDVRLSCAEAVPAGSLGMWNLPDAWVRGTSFLARVCDDLAGCAAIVCMMEELVNRQVEGHVIGMFDRAEEVGFAGVIAACEKGWVPKGSRVVGLETSKAMVGGTAGQGAIVRVGDRSSLFSSSLTHFLMQSAGFIADEDASFQFQRALMSGGMCNSTAFLTWGYDTAAMCLALHGYHNMAEHEQKIISESIELPDFHGMVRILVEAVKRYPKYEAGVGPMKSRLMAMHQAEHLPMLYDTVPRLMGS